MIFWGATGAVLYWIDPFEEGDMKRVISPRMSRVPIDQILELPTAERVAIVQEIWESMIEHPEDVEITAAQREELDRRWLDLQQNPDDGEPWEDVKKSFQNE